MADTRRPRGRSARNHDDDKGERGLNVLQEMAIAMQEQAEAAHQQAAAATQMMDMLSARHPESSNGNTANPRTPAPDREYQRFTEFKRANPPVFKGTFNPDRAEEWIREMEKIYSVLECTEQQKVAYATYMLQSDAEYWWTSHKQTLEGTGVVLTWEIFKTAFFGKYFPASVRNAKELEFLQLQQGNHSVAEYIAKFEELIKFSSNHQLNPDERWKCMKFEGGLREDILEVVGPMEIREYGVLVNKCRMIEEYKQKTALKRETSCNFKKKLGPQPYKFKNTKSRFQQIKNQEGQNSGKECNQCHRAHGDRPCLAGQGVCFRCGKAGHMARNCQNHINCFRCGKMGHYATDCRSSEPQANARPRQLGGVFTTSAAEATPSESLNESKCKN